MQREARLGRAAGVLGLADAADRGLVAKLGPSLTILITAALWALLHIQYEWFFIIEIVTLGIFLGWMRWKSGSTLLTIILHGTNNALALVALAFGQ